MNPYESVYSFTKVYSDLDAHSVELSKIRLNLLLGAGVLSGRIADLGCSVGSFLQFAKSHGYEGVGLDCSPWAVREAKKKGLTVYRRDMQSLNGELGNVSAVTLFDSLEHVKNPLSLLRKVWRLLPPGGVLIVSTPDSEGVTNYSLWRHFKPGEHIHYFTEKSLVEGIRKCGFEVVHIGQEEDAVRRYDGRKRNILSIVARKKDEHVPGTV